MTHLSHPHTFESFLLQTPLPWQIFGIAAKRALRMKRKCESFLHYVEQFELALFQFDFNFQWPVLLCIIALALTKVTQQPQQKKKVRTHTNRIIAVYLVTLISEYIKLKKVFSSRIGN